MAAGFRPRGGDSIFECGSGILVQASEQLAILAERIHEREHGEWRHIITAVTMNPGATRRDVVVQAYGPLIDIGQGGVIADFYNYRFEFHLSSCWRIRRVYTQYVGCAVPVIEAPPALLDRDPPQPQFNKASISLRGRLLHSGPRTPGIEQHLQCQRGAHRLNQPHRARAVPGGIRDPRGAVRPKGVQSAFRCPQNCSCVCHHEGCTPSRR